MQISQNGIEFIKRHEGLVLRPYKDAVGKWTVGYGHLLDQVTDAKSGPITKEQAEELLKQDLIIYEKGVERLITAPLKQPQFDALTSFTFNLGIGALQRSTLRAKLNRKEYSAAADEFLKWNKGKVRGKFMVLGGLDRRRREEKAMFLNIPKSLSTPTTSQPNLVDPTSKTTKEWYEKILESLYRLFQK